MILFLVAAVSGASVNITWDKELTEEAVRGGFVKHVQETANSAFAIVTNQLGVTLSKDLKVTVHTPEAYASRFGQDSSDRNGAHYHKGEVHVNAGFPIDGYFTGLLCHEITHAVLDRQDTGWKVPLWLNEGLAEFFSYRCRGMPGVDVVQHTYLKEASGNGVLKPLPQLSYPFGRMQYLECYSALVYLLEKHGDKVFKFIDAIVTGTAADSASRDVLNRSLADIDSGYLAWVKAFEG